eukprot:5373867-Prymnesium_polylepis.1
MAGTWVAVLAVPSRGFGRRRPAAVAPDRHDAAADSAASVRAKSAWTDLRALLVRRPRSTPASVDEHLKPPVSPVRAARPARPEGAPYCMGSGVA